MEYQHQIKNICITEDGGHRWTDLKLSAIIWTFANHPVDITREVHFYWIFHLTKNTIKYLNEKFSFEIEMNYFFC
jgi:hypothetical protein